MSAPPSHYHGIDIANLNALVVDIRERLSGGLSGDFYEKGGTIKEGARHAQLPLLFNAMAKIESLVSALQKQAAITEADATKETEKPGGKPNKNMMATIKEMIHAEVEAKTRTVTIESERMKAAMQKLETQNAHLVDEVASLRTKVKKGCSQPAAGSDARYYALSKQCDGMERKQRRYEASHAALAMRVDALDGEPVVTENSASKQTRWKSANIDYNITGGNDSFDLDNDSTASPIDYNRQGFGMEDLRRLLEVPEVPAAAPWDWG